MRGAVGDLLSWVGRRLAPHRAFASVVAAATVLRALVAAAYRPGLFFHADTYVYLRGAQQLLPGLYRPSFYSIFLHVVLSAVHDLNVVPLLQHAMGIAIACLVYALLRRLGVGPLGACLGALPVLADGYQLDIEQFVLSEPLFQLLCAGALVTLAWRARPTIAQAATAGVMLGVAAVTRSVGLVVIVPAGAYLARRSGMRPAGVLVGAFAVPLAVYALWFHSAYGSFALSARNGYFMYGRTAPFADCSALDLPPRERPLCDPRPPEDRPGPNFYIWSKDSPIRSVDPPRGQTKDSALMSVALRAIERQPLAYAPTIAGDVLHYFAPGRFTGPRDERLSVWQFPVHAGDPGPFAPVVRQFGASPPPHMTLLAGSPRLHIVEPLARAARVYQTVVYTPGPVLALALLLGLAGGTLPNDTGARGRAEALLFAGTGLLLLVGAAASSMFDYRYLLPALPLLPPAGVLGARLLRTRGERLIGRATA